MDFTRLDNKGYFLEEISGNTHIFGPVQQKVFLLTVKVTMRPLVVLEDRTNSNPYWIIYKPNL
jgi:hypothetical protein